MADIRISQLPELEAAPADSDVLILNDVSVASTKKITFGNLLSNYASNIVDSADGAKCLGDFLIANELTLGGDLTSTANASFGTVNADQLRVITPGSTPTSSTPGQNGEIRYDTSYLYIYQSGAWYRASLALVP